LGPVWVRLDKARLAVGVGLLGLASPKTQALRFFAPRSYKT
jgi:hypothetical protein